MLGNLRAGKHIRRVSKERSDRIAVVGGGPAGFFAAIKCAEENPTAQITIFEASNRPLDKIRISGGGRCNVTHACFDPKELIKNYPRGSKELLGPFYTFQPTDMINWLKKWGVDIKTEADGRIFPVTDSSMTILNCLKEAAQKNRIKIIINTPVTNISYDADASRFTLGLNQADDFICDKLLLATGSSPQGYKLIRQLGHKLIPPVPSLFTFKIKDQRLTELSGISFKEVEVHLPAHKKRLTRGPMLITHWGLSGPAILKLSAFAARELHEAGYQFKIKINFVPTINTTQLTEQIERTKKELARKQVRSTPLFELPKHYWQTMLDFIKLEHDTTWANIKKGHLRLLIQELTAAEFEVSGKGIFKEEFVTCGGVDLKEVDFKTMESRLVPNLYFAGEVLNIDGITGGFNFQNAWTTGWIAGIDLAH